MDVIVLATMPIGMIGFIFGLIAFSKVVRLESEVVRLQQMLDNTTKD
ncbi:hypothetical protein N9W78_01660 [bacterium]|nr:hypothetical protein [bacterium]